MNSSSCHIKLQTKKQISNNNEKNSIPINQQGDCTWVETLGFLLATCFKPKKHHSWLWITNYGDEERVENIVIYFVIWANQPLLVDRYRFLFIVVAYLFLCLLLDNEFIGFDYFDIYQPKKWCIAMHETSYSDNSITTHTLFANCYKSKSM